MKSCTSQYFTAHMHVMKLLLLVVVVEVEHYTCRMNKDKLNDVKATSTNHDKRSRKFNPKFV